MPTVSTGSHENPADFGYWFGLTTPCCRPRLIWSAH